mmetsp:Transcript_17126/g.25345  ORF Transcript_17126/g.25345 Transcript_17126/m.25345 type:complete len:164 (+) Transcript_17126:114-605(+)|eukprot:CAMPEP_0171462234 /NCGR_PEP_ID=MMETSP0945-20130129/6352_1 /TAXON_ID=109269 /ORGANISM="Vaucheria litorea, Strain CCMP2940" /LENGTH=163 /DNA_ID=CAMNT_0011988717 /DNA_START=96 /DNA_END=587 /DNA_ORIENTATION=+
MNAKMYGLMENSPVHTNVGKRLHSTQLMQLCASSNLNDFKDVVDFLRLHLDDVINEVHGFEKLLVDDGKVSLNCPPPPEAGDTHGGLLVRTISEQSPDEGEHIILSREFKVHDLGACSDDSPFHRIEIRCDVTRMMPDDSRILEEEKAVVEVLRKAPIKINNF